MSRFGERSEPRTRRRSATRWRTWSGLRRTGAGALVALSRSGASGPTTAIVASSFASTAGTADEFGATVPTPLVPGQPTPRPLHHFYRHDVADPVPGPDASEGPPLESQYPTGQCLCASG